MLRTTWPPTSGPVVSDAGGDLDLDFHAIMHWGEDAALEKHYVLRIAETFNVSLDHLAVDDIPRRLLHAAVNELGDRLGAIAELRGWR